MITRSTKKGRNVKEKHVFGLDPRNPHYGEDCPWFVKILTGTHSLRRRYREERPINRRPARKRGDSAKAMPHYLRTTRRKTGPPLAHSAQRRNHGTRIPVFPSSSNPPWPSARAQYVVSLVGFLFRTCPYLPSRLTPFEETLANAL